MKKIILTLLCLLMLPLLTAYRPGVDYMAIAIECAASGDTDGGRAAMEARDAKIDALGLDVVKVDYNDLVLLGKIMTLEAGNCPHDVCPLGVGEVVLNRTISPEWNTPTIQEVLERPGQYYYPSLAGRFERSLPSERCLTLALRLLEGERNMEPSVIFQDNQVHGSGAHVSYLHDGHSRLYFSYSSRPKLYEDATT